ncbi:ATP synthase I chain [Dethiosulfatibacter aminovorans DSM 17477]|uniref:ATP synthase I chain n=1 Tax=Dethiosulfatibacter aminovorans DSM 17477 TaxID=1121476 RepID=A0A1M6LSZ5_9FIRM|nr:ATP synthase subunit I [Dethiosulfatibacter aminovorans]SHJ74337.1 ATP synthase I chain [Dethiosulfatibacter aminovorans DSM 17477]
MNETAKLQVKIIKKNLIVLCVLIIFSFLFLNEPLKWTYGFIFGGFIGILNFMQLARTVEKAVKMNPGSAQAYASISYFIRFAIMAVVLIVSLKADYINALATIIGLLSIKFIILVTNLFNDRTYYKRIFRRKEEK